MTMAVRVSELQWQGMAAQAATANLRSPVASLRRSPIVKHSPSSILSSVQSLRVLEDGSNKGFHSAGVQSHAGKIATSGSQSEKKTPASVMNRKKRKSTGKLLCPERKKKSKKSENTDLPKRPPTTFIYFMSSHREELKKEILNMQSTATLSKSAGAKWKSMSNDEKLPYFKLAADSKAACEAALESYRAKHLTQANDCQNPADGSGTNINSNVKEGVGDNIINSN